MSYPERPTNRKPEMQLYEFLSVADEKPSTMNKALHTYLNNSIVEYLDIPAQVKKSLFLYGIRTLSDLDFASNEEILEYHGIAQKNLLKIRAAADKLRHEIITGLVQSK
jgi:hypothetical protein